MKKGSPSEDKRLCSCGCGTLIPVIDAYGIERFFRNGHSWKGKTIPVLAKKKMSLSHIGKRTGNDHHYWKGDDVGYAALHKWIRRNKPKTDVCEICGLKKPEECANISGKYRRDVTDFIWLCRKCHKQFDKH